MRVGPDTDVVLLAAFAIRGNLEPSDEKLQGPGNVGDLHAKGSRPLALDPDAKFGLAFD